MYEADISDGGLLWGWDTTRDRGEGVEHGGAASGALRSLPLRGSLASSGGLKAW